MEENLKAVKEPNNLPDSETCKARAHDGANYELAHCLIEHPLCSFALHFGPLHLCRHPQRKEFIKRTKAMFDDPETAST